MSVLVFELLKLARDFLFITRNGVSFEVEQLVEVLLGTILFTEKFLLESVQSVFESSVFFDKLNVLFGQIFFVLGQKINFAALGFFLAETRIRSHIVAWGLLVVKAKFFLDEFFLLFSKLVISQKLIVTGSFFSYKLKLFSKLFDFQFHAFPAVFIIQSMSLSIIILWAQQPAVMLDFIQKRMLLIIHDFDFLSKFGHFFLVVLELFFVRVDQLPDIH